MDIGDSAKASRLGKYNGIAISGVFGDAAIISVNPFYSNSGEAVAVSI